MSEWENNVRKPEPYTPGEQPKDRDIIKLNTNENPYPPAPAAAQILKDFRYADLRLYPDPQASDLVKAIADTYSVKPSQVFVGSGSDDVLSMSFLTFFASDKPVLFPEITYSFYDVWAELYGVPYEQIPLKDDLTIDPADYMKENGGIIFANPNAPTGIFMETDAVEKILSENPRSVVIVDEAYIDFGGTSCLPLIKKYDNLLVVQTFSKSRSMAGLRIGYAIGSEKLIQYLNDVKFSVNSYTMNRPSLELGTEAVKDDEYFKQTLAKIINTRERMKKELSALGFSFPDSKSNFIFASHATVPAEDIFKYLRGKNIYVRYFKQDRIDNYLRITVGTDEEADALIDALKEFLIK